MTLKMRWESIGVSNHRLFSENIFKEIDAIQMCVPLEITRNQLFLSLETLRNRDKEWAYL